MKTAAGFGLACLAVLALDGCHRGCFQLLNRVTLTGQVPCCGGAVINDVELSQRDLAVDLANTAHAQTGHVDAFLTTAECTKLFNTYNGGADVPLCPVYIGPVGEGSISDRHSLPRGTYRVFAQAWSSNSAAKSFDIDVGVWEKESCLIVNP